MIQVTYIDTRSDHREEKKRKRTNKKKIKNVTLPVTEVKQTTPPRVLLSTLFPSRYPTGELVPYENLSRTTDEESRYNSRLWDEDFLTDYRQAAEIHRQVRQYAQKELIKPGASLLAVAEVSKMMLGPCQAIRALKLMMDSKRAWVFLLGYA